MKRGDENPDGRRFPRVFNVGTITRRRSGDEDRRQERGVIKKQVPLGV